MSEIKKKESKVQTKKRVVSDNESEYSSDEPESEDDSSIRSRTPSKRKVVNTEQKDDMQPSDATRRRRRGRGGRSPARRGGGRSRSRRSGGRSSQSRRRR